MFEKSELAKIYCIKLNQLIQKNETDSQLISAAADKNERNTHFVPLSGTTWVSGY